VNGLETSLALAGLAWCFVWAGDRSTHRLALVCGVLPFIRPELGLCSVLMLANAALDRPRRLSVWLGLAAAAALPWALPMWWQTGSVFPSSLQAKRAWFIQDCIPWSQRASIVSLGLAMWLGLSAGTLPGLVGLCRERTGRLALALIALTILGWLVLAPGLTDGYQRFRYQAPLVAALTWGVSLLPRDQRRWALAWGAVASIAFGLQVTAVESAFRSGLRRDRTAVTTLLRSHGASRVMVHDAGYLAYADAAPVLVDMVGLKTPSAAADHARWTAPSCGEDRWRALDATARATRPEYLLIWQSWDELYSVTEGLDRAGWKVTRVSDLNGTLWLYRLSLPGRAGEGP
jgi:hypothetical protein